MKTFLSVLAFGFMFSLSAQAIKGGSGAHGGKVYLCKEPSTGTTFYELVDFHRIKTKFGGTIRQSEEELKPKADYRLIIEEWISEFEKKAPVRAAYYRIQVQKFHDRADFTYRTKLSVPQMKTPEGYVSNSQFDQSEIPVNCEEEPKYAIHYRTEAEKRYVLSDSASNLKDFIVDPIFESLSPVTRAGLVLHEVVQEDFISIGENSSTETEKVFEAMAEIISNEAGTHTPAEVQAQFCASGFGLLADSAHQDGVRLVIPCEKDFFDPKVLERPSDKTGFSRPLRFGWVNMVAFQGVESKAVKLKADSASNFFYWKRDPDSGVIHFLLSRGTVEGDLDIVLPGFKNKVSPSGVNHFNIEPEVAAFSGIISGDLAISRTLLVSFPFAPKDYAYCYDGMRSRGDLTAYYDCYPGKSEFHEYLFGQIASNPEQNKLFEKYRGESTYSLSGWPAWGVNFYYSKTLNLFQIFYRTRAAELRTPKKRWNYIEVRFDLHGKVHSVSLAKTHPGKL
jgi:hypothetical protein